MEKKPFDVVHQKFEDEPEYNDVKRGDQSGDNDIDRVTTPVDAEDKKQTDEAYIKNSSQGLNEQKQA